MTMFLNPVNGDIKEEKAFIIEDELTSPELIEVIEDLTGEYIIV